MLNYLFKKKFSIAIFSLLSFTLMAQDEEEVKVSQKSDTIQGYYFGLNLGTYFANKYTANEYNGLGYNNFTGIKNFDFDQSDLANTLGVNNPTLNPNYNRVMQELGGYNFVLAELPYNMRYTVGFLIGLNVSYYFNPSNSLFLNVNAIKLTTTDQFTLRLTDLSPTADPSQNKERQLFPIVGKEQRIQFLSGYQKVLSKSEIANPYIEFGGNMTLVKFEKNEIQINNFITDITTDYDFSTNVATLSRIQTGIGFGGFASLGLQIKLGDQFGLNFGYIASMEKIALGPGQKQKLQNTIMLRAIYL
jgi:hypothetical protein